MDNALRRSLASSLGVEVTPKTEWRFPDGGEPYAVTVGCDLRGLTPESRATALAKIEAAREPAERERLEEWLVALQLGCAPRREDEAGMAIALELYVSILRRYPADVAKTACMNLVRRPSKGPNWFPTVSELENECRKLASPREAMFFALKNWKPKTPGEEQAEILEHRARMLRIAATEVHHRIPPGEMTDAKRAVLAEADAMDAEAWEMETKARKLREGRA